MIEFQLGSLITLPWQVKKNLKLQQISKLMRKGIWNSRLQVRRHHLAVNLLFWMQKGMLLVKSLQLCYTLQDLYNLFIDLVWYNLRAKVCNSLGVKRRQKFWIRRGMGKSWDYIKIKYQQEKFILQLIKLPNQTASNKSTTDCDW